MYEEVRDDLTSLTVKLWALLNHASYDDSGPIRAAIQKISETYGLINNLKDY